MNAVVGLWTMDPERRKRQEQDLHEKIMPTVKSAPGFVRGTWSREVGGDCSITFIVFEDEPAARGFIDRVQGNAPRQAGAGVTNDELVLVELLAEA